MNQQPKTRLLSLCMIARNSGLTLERTLASVKSIVDEIIIVDTGSTDDTTEIAQRFGAQILDFEWNDNFSQARNLGLAAAQGHWILVLDSDEWMLPAAAAAVRSVLEAQQETPHLSRLAFRLLNRSLPAKGVGRGSVAFLTRLFPNNANIRFEFPVHEQVDTSLARAEFEIKDLAIEILHDGYTDPAVRMQKQIRNLNILQKQIAETPAHPITRFLMAGSLLDLNRDEEALLAYKVCYLEAEKQKHFASMEGSVVRVATCLFRLKRWEETRRFCDSVEGTPTTHPEFLMTHARALAALGDKPAALALMEKVLTLPNVPRIPPCDHEAAIFQTSLWLTNEMFQRHPPPETP